MLHNIDQPENQGHTNTSHYST